MPLAAAVRRLMRGTRALPFLVALVLVHGACDSGRSGIRVDAGAIDAGSSIPTDTGMGLDGGAPDAGSMLDAGPPFDASGSDSGVTMDAGPPCGGPCSGGMTCCPSGVTTRCVMLPAGVTECPLPDLTIDPARVTSDMSFGWEFFEDTDCSVEDACVRAPGWRRLMRFSTQTPNLGNGDAYFGAPRAGNPAFDYSACTMQYRFNTYAEYHLRTSGGTEIATGYKRAFCLMDTNRYVIAPETPAAAQYGCSDQGITRGWSDVYSAGLDCQWVDVTDLAPGDYTLRVSLNIGHRLVESSYANNDVDVPVTIPADISRDPLLACTGTAMGPSRDCGWVVAGMFPCTAGAMIAAACTTGCVAGACTGDPVMRVCPGTTACTGREALGSDDDCAAGNYCPRATFTCPASGQVTVLTAAYRAGELYTCTATVM